jgi:hypothetical protein
MQIVPDDEISPQVANLINCFNDDARMTFRDGMRSFEAVAVAGSITQTLLSAIDKGERRILWDIIVKIMERKFSTGEL